MHSHNPELTLEDWRRWRSDPVTIELKRELASAFFAQMDEDLPEDSAKAMPLVFKREGAKTLLDEVFSWVPKRIQELLSDSGEEAADA